jgi:hypothetical protein
VWAWLVNVGVLLGFLATGTWHESATQPFHLGENGPGR